METEDTPLFQTQGLRFQDFLSYPDLVLPRDRATFLVGPSGVGKSTLLRLFNATLSPSAGRVLYNGRDVASMDTLALRREVSLVSQEPYLFDGTIWEKSLQYYGYRESACRKSTALELLNLMDLDFPLNSSVTTMSGGERQRVYLAIFLSFLPRVLMLDEPTSALDERTGELVISNLIGFCRKEGIQFLAISHNPQLVERYSQNTVPIERKTI